MVGPGGAGKSTFARQLGAQLDLPVVHLDADTVIAVARSRLACVVSAVGRSERHHGKSVQADGCPERFQLEFYRWIWNYERDSRPRLDAALQRHEHLDVVELSTPAR